MKVDLEDLGGLKYRLKIEVEPEDYRRTRNRLARSYAPQVNLRGFRPGKAPLEMIMRSLGPSLDLEAQEQSMNEALQTALRDNGLRPSTDPKVEVEPKGEDETLRFSAEFESFPKVELKDYLGIEVEEPSVPGITDEDVDSTLERIRQSAGRFQELPEDSVAHEGDMTLCDVVLKATDDDIVIRESYESRILAGIDDEPVKDVGRALLGMKAGEEKTVTGDLGRIAARGIAKPEDDEDWAPPETITAVITIKKLMRKEIPEINDDFAQQYSGAETVEGLRAQVRERLEANRLEAVKEQLREAVVDIVVRDNPLDIGRETIERLASLAEEEAKERMLPKASPEERAKIDLGIPREKSEEDARQNLQRMVILQAIAEKEGIEVTDEDVDARLKELSGQTGIPFPRLKARIGEEQLEQMARRIRVDKTVDLLQRYAVVKAPAAIEATPAEQPSDTEAVEPPVVKAAATEPLIDEPTPDAIAPEPDTTPAE
jgi:trigger factor